jgi:hypothetical protein
MFLSNRLVHKHFHEHGVDTPDLAGNGLRWVHELCTPDALTGRKVSVSREHDAAREVRCSTSCWVHRENFSLSLDEPLVEVF